MGAIVETTSSGTVDVSGSVTNSGTLFASGSNSELLITSGAVVNGGSVEVGNGIVDIASTGSESVRFLSNGSGGLEIADMAGATSVYSGKISGFGGSGHTNSGQYIDLTSVTYSGGAISGSYSGNSSSGTLTISSGGTAVASIQFVGAYSGGNFQFSSGVNGSVEITDPTVVNGGSVTSAPAAFPQNGIDLSQFAFDANDMTLGYAENNTDTGGTLTVSNGGEAVKVALLGNYMATSFVTAADGHGGTLVTQRPQANDQPLLAHPHA
jgi:hypothetical protein